jgi:Staphylococcal nuclease homologue
VAIRWKFMDRAFDSGASMLRKAHSSVGARTVSSTVALRRLLTIWMLSLPAGRVICLPINRDRYGRTVATCSVGADLSEWLVQNGLALDWPLYSKGKYDTVQRAAEQAGQGIWGGSYVEPWPYRCIRARGTPANC